MSKLIGLTVTRNDGWCLGFSLRVALDYCDEVIVGFHSTQGEPLGDAASMKAIDTLPPSAFDRVRIMHFRTAGPETWPEARIRHQMHDEGRRQGGTHFAVIDADEAITSNLRSSIREMILETEPGELLTLRQVAPWNGLHNRRIDGGMGRASEFSVAFGDAPGLEWAIPEDDYQMHARLPAGLTKSRLPLTDMSDGGVMHFQYASMRRLAAKATWYKLLEQARYPGRKTAAELNEMYDWAIVGTGQPDDTREIIPLPPEWITGWEDWARYIDLDTEPWQLAEAKKIHAHLKATQPVLLEGLELWTIDPSAC